MESKTLVFTIQTEDVGATQRTEILLGDKILYSFEPGTRYEETALEVAERILVRSFSQLIEGTIQGD